MGFSHGRLIAAGLAIVTGYRAWFSGAAAPIRNEVSITRLTNTNFVRDATISRDGNYFVYNEELDGTSRVWLQQTGRSQRVEIIPGGKWPICCKTFSPDGKFIYFLVTGAREKRNDLYRVATLGGMIEKVLEDVNSHVSFSPDGEQIIFQRYSAEKKSTAFILAASDGKGDQREVLASNEQFQTRLCRMGAGRQKDRIYFGNSRSTIGRRLFVVDVGSRKPSDKPDLR
jgi:Tol biopolymer transport system component